MSHDVTRAVLAIAIVVGFFGVIGTVLFGFVDVSDPTIAKLVGLIFGYVSGLLQPVLLVYFGTVGPTPPKE